MHYYLGLRKKVTPHRTLGQRPNAPVDLNTPVSSFREQVGARREAAAWVPAFVEHCFWASAVQRPGTGVSLWSISS